MKLDFNPCLFLLDATVRGSLGAMKNGFPFLTTWPPTVIWSQPDAKRAPLLPPLGHCPANPKILTQRTHGRCPCTTPPDPHPPLAYRNHPRKLVRHHHVVSRPAQRSTLAPPAGEITLPGISASRRWAMTKLIAATKTAIFMAANHNVVCVSSFAGYLSPTPRFQCVIFLFVDCWRFLATNKVDVSHIFLHFPYLSLSVDPTIGREELCYFASGTKRNAASSLVRNPSRWSFSLYWDLQRTQKYRAVMHYIITWSASGLVWLHCKLSKSSTPSTIKREN